MKKNMITAGLWAGVMASMSAPAFAEGNWILGGLVGGETNPYVGGKDTVTALPYVAYETENLHIGIDGINYTILNSDSLSFSAILEYRAEPDMPNTALFNGLIRDDSFEAGFDATYSFGNTYVDASLVGDVSDTHKGFEGRLALGYATQIGEISLDAKAGVIHRDRKLNNHLFGVAASEANASRSAFAMSDSTNPFASVTAAYQLSDSSFLIGELSYEDLGDAKNSPLVAKSDTVSLLIGVGWQF